MSKAMSYEMSFCKENEHLQHMSDVVGVMIDAAGLVDSVTVIGACLLIVEGVLDGVRQHLGEADATKTGLIAAALSAQISVRAILRDVPEA